MKRFVTSSEMKNFDNYTIEKMGIPSMVLMERAALVSVEEFLKGGDLPYSWEFDTKNILCICGSGNNGGDGFAIARLLFLKKMNVEILFVGKWNKASQETKQQYNICKNYGVPIHMCNSANDTNIIKTRDWTSIVDGLFGIGLGRPVEGIYENVINIINDQREKSFSDYPKISPTRTLSIDIPSGISADTGEVMGTAVHADKTVTFAYNKVGITIGEGASYAGETVVRDIGIRAPEDMIYIG